MSRFGQIAANPELQRMGPQVRQMMQSEVRLPPPARGPRSFATSLPLCRSPCTPSGPAAISELPDQPRGHAQHAPVSLDPSQLAASVFLTDRSPDISRMMGSGMFGGGASGAGGAGAFPAPGGAGGNAGLFNPWANDAAAATPAAGAGSPPAAGTPGAFNPFAALGGMGGFGGAGAGATAGAGGAPDFQQMMQQVSRNGLL